MPSSLTTRFGCSTILSPRALSPKVKGFKRAQSWYQDLTQVCVE
jgi:hypothetical protein